MSHSHILYDSDPHFKIDPISRNIIDGSSKKVRLMQYDHNSERFTFEIPQEIEGHDMSLCNLVEIHYVSIESNTKVVRGGVYTVDDLHVESGNDKLVVFSWLIPNKVTQYVGQLQFLVRFACVNDVNGGIEYVWNTGIYSGINISSGIYNRDSQSDNQVPPYNFVTTLDGNVLKFYVGSEEEYNQLKDSGLLVDCMCFVEDDDIEDISDRFNGIEAEIANVQTDIEAEIANLQIDINELQTDIEEVKDGSVSVPKANILAGYPVGTYQVNGGVTTQKVPLQAGSVYLLRFTLDWGVMERTSHYTFILSVGGDTTGNSVSTSAGGGYVFTYVPSGYVGTSDIDPYNGKQEKLVLWDEDTSKTVDEIGTLEILRIA